MKIEIIVKRKQEYIKLLTTSNDTIYCIRENINNLRVL